MSPHSTSAQKYLGKVSEEATKKRSSGHVQHEENLAILTKLKNSYRLFSISRLNLVMERNYRHFLPIHEVSKEDYSNHDEYRTRVSLELCLPENRGAAMKLLADDTRSRCFRVSVEGYDTSRPALEIKDALFKHFNFSCGGIFDVVVSIDPVTNLVDRRAFVYLMEEEAVTRALALNGSDVGRWKAIVQFSPGQRECLLNPEHADILRTVYYHKQCSTAICVEGYDISLPEDEVKNALIKHFCSCGVITDFSIYQNPRMAFLNFYGQDEVRRALTLNGSNMGGWTVVAKPLQRTMGLEGSNVGGWTVAAKPLGRFPIAAKQFPVLYADYNLFLR